MNTRYLKMGMAALAAPFATMSQACADEQPNILVILADDMGYSDISCYGGEVSTPNLDRLANEGIRWTQFYNCARSCPSRACLMTGLYPHQTGIGWMTAADLGTPQYQGYLNRECVTIAEVLQQSGYSTYLSGKWHLSSDRQNDGEVSEFWPCSRGFDHFFGIVGGAASYYTPTIVRDDTVIERPENFYLTSAITENAVTYIQEHDYDEKPLFMYLAYTAPHWPLHALEEDIDRYRGVYEKGWDRIRAERLERQKAMGIFSKDAGLTERDPKVPAWEELSDREKKEFALRMSIYAAQIDRMDQGIGQVVEALKAEGQYENTVIFFMSDNGGCAEHIGNAPLERIDGSARSFESYRTHWANASNTPYREYKHYTHEGGIATPLIISWPERIKARQKGRMVRTYGHFKDIMATCIDIAGVPYPENYAGHHIVPLEGRSLLPAIDGKKMKPEKLFWEHETNIAVRDGRWKMVVRTGEGKPYDFSKPELYDLKKDPTELHDLSAEMPERSAAMMADWEAWARHANVYPLDSRKFNIRENGYRRNINGDFQENLGHWTTECSGSSQVTYSIEKGNTITGEKSARIEIRASGQSHQDATLRWNFPSQGKERVRITFKMGASAANTVGVGLKKKNAPEQIEEIEILPGTHEYRVETFPELINGKWSLNFHFGLSRPAILLMDDVRLKFIR